LDRFFTYLNFFSSIFNVAEIRVRSRIFFSLIFTRNSAFSPFYTGNTNDFHFLPIWFLFSWPVTNMGPSKAYFGQINGQRLVKRLSKTNQTVAIGLTRLQCRLQDPRNGSKLGSLTSKILPQTYPECFGDPNDPTCGMHSVIQSSLQFLCIYSVL